MKVAIIGSRGFLTEYGGYETFVRKLALGLRNKGFAVTVYGIADYHNRNNDVLFPEIKRVWLQTIHVRFLEKVVSSFLGVLHACFSNANIILSISVSPGLLLFLPRLFGKEVIVNPDGLEWQRPKWSKFISFWLQLCELAAVKFSNLVVADSKSIARYIKEKYNKKVVFIPYGADSNFPDNEDITVLKQYGLIPNAYFLQVCRLEPENNAHITIREFLNYRGAKQLVIIGDTPHSIKYRENLKKCANGKVKLLGGIYGEDFKIILRNAYCYIHGHEAGGTNPVLLEAMALNNCVLVLNIPYNLEVIGDCGICFSKKPGDLLEKIKTLDKNVNLVNVLKKKAFIRVKKLYTWERVICEYDQVFKRLLRPGSKAMFHRGRRRMRSTKM